MSYTMALIGLDAGTTYQVRVVAKNGDGFEAAAAWLELHTEGVGKGLCFNQVVSFMIQ